VGAAFGTCRYQATPPPFPTTGVPMAKPNYSFEKRQRELAKKKKKEEKRLKKQSTEDLPKPADE
jgi:hypothetical protein